MVRAQVTLSANGTEVISAPKLLITNDPSTWEASLVEAPWVVKHAQSGYYYLFYSGNWSDSYAVGVARAPAVTGPYVKHGAAILHTSGNTALPVQGSGHCSVIVDPNTGGLAMLYHSWVPKRDGPRHVMLDKVTWSSDSPPWPVVFDGSSYPSSTTQPIP